MFSDVKVKFSVYFSIETLHKSGLFDRRWSPFDQSRKSSVSEEKKKKSPPQEKTDGDSFHFLTSI